MGELYDFGGVRQQVALLRVVLREVDRLDLAFEFADVDPSEVIPLFDPVAEVVEDILVKMGRADGN